MVATENLPESLQKVKGAFDGAVGAVAGMLPGSGGADDNASEGSVADEVRCLGFLSQGNGKQFFFRKKWRVRNSALYLTACCECYDDDGTS